MSNIADFMYASPINWEQIKLKFSITDEPNFNSMNEIFCES